MADPRVAGENAEIKMKLKNIIASTTVSVIASRILSPETTLGFSKPRTSLIASS
jgi:hypothetical protein